MKRQLLSAWLVLSGLLASAQTNDYPTTGDVTIYSYSPQIILRRTTDEGGFVQGIQTRLANSTNNWFYGNVHEDKWLVSKGDYQNPKLVIKSNGNTGVGISEPVTPFHVNGGETMSGGWNKTSTLQATYPVQIFNSSGTKWAGIGYDYSAAMRFWVNAGSDDLNGTGSHAMAILNNGNVLIGKFSESGSYKLDVGGRVRANEVVVNTTGADFVFDEGYKVLKLEELEGFIRSNKHLPGIAPAKQMQEEGVGVSELQTKLLQKIEELTLYVIEQNKQLQEQSRKLDEQAELHRKEIAALKAKIK